MTSVALNVLLITGIIGCTATYFAMDMRLVSTVISPIVAKRVEWVFKTNHELCRHKDLNDPAWHKPPDIYNRELAVTPFVQGSESWARATYLRTHWKSAMPQFEPVENTVVSFTCCYMKDKAKCEAIMLGTCGPWLVVYEEPTPKYGQWGLFYYHVHCRQPESASPMVPHTVGSPHYLSQPDHYHGWLEPPATGSSVALNPGELLMVALGRDSWRHKHPYRPQAEFDDSKQEVLVATNVPVHGSQPDLSIGPVTTTSNPVSTSRDVEEIIRRCNHSHIDRHAPQVHWRLDDCEGELRVARPELFQTCTIKEECTRLHFDELTIDEDFVKGLGFELQASGSIATVCSLPHIETDAQGRWRLDDTRRALTGLDLVDDLIDLWRRDKSLIDQLVEQVIDLEDQLGKAQANTTGSMVDDGVDPIFSFCDKSHCDELGCQTLYCTHLPTDLLVNHTCVGCCDCPHLLDHTCAPCDRAHVDNVMVNCDVVSEDDKVLVRAALDVIQISEKGRVVIHAPRSIYLMAYPDDPVGDQRLFNSLPGDHLTTLVSTFARSLCTHAFQEWLFDNDLYNQLEHVNEHRSRLAVTMNPRLAVAGPMYVRFSWWLADRKTNLYYLVTR